jgi:hypothetical protein
MKEKEKEKESETEKKFFLFSYVIVYVGYFVMQETTHSILMRYRKNVQL